MRVVVAIGGNALSAKADTQEEQLRSAVKALSPVLRTNSEIVLVHGNGPQVGIIHGAFEQAREPGNNPMPFYDCTAMNQGAIGYHLEQALRTELETAGDGKAAAATVVTRVLVDRNDPAFSHPDKPVGTFYTETEAKQLMEETGRLYGPDSGRGWRLLVPSPAAKHIVEADLIRELAESGAVVLGGGGAGIPVIPNEDGGYTPIEAVCDKDLTSAMLADLIGADMLLILTAVDNVAVNFGQPDQRNLTHMTPDEAEALIAEGQFAPGSMLPKVTACVEFVRGGEGRTAAIGNLKHAAEVLAGSSGTIVSESAQSPDPAQKGAHG